MTALTTPAPRKLSVGETVAACYAAVAHNLGQLVRISWLWLLIVLPPYAGSLWLVWTVWAAGSGEHVVNAVAMLPLVIELPFLSSIAVGWHRLLLRRETVTSAVYLRLDGIVWRYALASLALTLLIQLPLASLYNSAGYFRDLYIGDLALHLALNLLALAAIFLLRLCLVLPAIAVGESASVSQAWRMTRNNTLRLALASALCALPQMVAYGLVLKLADGGGPVTFVIVGLIYLAFDAILVIVSATLLSLAYRFFAGPRNEAAPLAA